MFDKFQQQLMETYEGGYFAYCKTQKEVDECGDGLFKFLMIELSEREWCNDVSEVIRRLDTIRRQIQEVVIKWPDEED